MKKIIISIVAIVLLFFCGLIAFYVLNVNATFGKNEEVIVEIEKGSSSNKIAQKLEKSKFSNPDFFFNTHSAKAIFESAFLNYIVNLIKLMV